MPEIEEVRAKYLQIAGYIRDQIVRGDLKPGDDVPSEREIVNTWRVARPTAARALEALRAQGLVESRRGSGTYVRATTAAPRARERYKRARDLGTMYSAAESIEFLATAVVAGPEHVLDALQLPGDSHVVRRTRLIRGQDGQPVELSTSWFPRQLAELAPRLLEPERLRGRHRHVSCEDHWPGACLCARPRRRPARHGRGAPVLGAAAPRRGSRLQADGVRPCRRTHPVRRRHVSTGALGVPPGVPALGIALPPLWKVA